MSEELEQLQRIPASSQRTKGQARRIRCRPSRWAHRDPSRTRLDQPCQMPHRRGRVAENASITPLATSPSSARSGTSGRAIHARPRAGKPRRRIIDKGHPDCRAARPSAGRQVSGLLPLYRQEGIFGRAGWRSRNRRWPSGWARRRICSRWSMCPRPACCAPPCCTRTPPVVMLDPGAAQTKRAYLVPFGVGASDPIKAVGGLRRQPRRPGHAQAFLGEWRSTLICDDYAEPGALIAWA